MLIDNVKLVDRGTLLEAKAEAVLASCQYPCRNIPQNMADLKAQVAANETGRQELLKVVENYGIDVVLAYMEERPEQWGGASGFSVLMVDFDAIRRAEEAMNVEEAPVEIEIEF